jgi:hypothetical protein
MYHLAAEENSGLTIDLTQAPDDLLKKILEWRNARVERQERSRKQ